MSKFTSLVALLVPLQYNRDTRYFGWPGHLFPPSAPPATSTKDDDVRESFAIGRASPDIFTPPPYALLPLIFTPSIVNGRDRIYIRRIIIARLAKMRLRANFPRANVNEQGRSREARRAKRGSEYEINSIPRRGRRARNSMHLYALAWKTPVRLLSTLSRFRTFLRCSFFFFLCPFSPPRMLRHAITPGEMRGNNKAHNIRGLVYLWN